MKRTTGRRRLDDQTPRQRWLREALRPLRWTQADLARELRIHVLTISGWARSPLPPDEEPESPQAHRRIVTSRAILEVVERERVARRSTLAPWYDTVKKLLAAGEVARAAEVVGQEFPALGDALRNPQGPVS